MPNDKQITCPKCGQEDTKCRLFYHASAKGCRYDIWKNIDDYVYKHLCSKFHGEHLHWMCFNCFGEWATPTKDTPDDFVRSETRIPFWLNLMAWGCMVVSISATSILVYKLVVDWWDK